MKNILDDAGTDRYLAKSELAALFGVSTRTIDAWVAAGRLPRPERLPSNRPRWRESVARAAVRVGSQNA